MPNEPMAKRIPIVAAKRLAREFGLTHVILYAHDGKSGHVVTFGKTAEQSGQAAEFGNAMKKSLGWPESLQAQPSRVRRLQARIAQLEARLAKHDGCSRFSVEDYGLLNKEGAGR